MSPGGFFSAATADWLATDEPPAELGVPEGVAPPAPEAGVPEAGAPEAVVALPLVPDADPVGAVTADVPAEAVAECVPAGDGEDEPEELQPATSAPATRPRQRGRRRGMTLTLGRAGQGWARVR